MGVRLRILPVLQHEVSLVITISLLLRPMCLDEFSPLHFTEEQRAETVEQRS